MKPRIECCHRTAMIMASNPFSQSLLMILKRLAILFGHSPCTQFILACVDVIFEFGTWLLKYLHHQTTSPLYQKSSFSVLRRYSDFLWLYETLSLNNPGVVVPPAPEKNPFGRFDNNFVQQRRQALGKCIQKTANHPVLCKDPDLKMFLESDTFALDVSSHASFESRLLHSAKCRLNIGKPKSHTKGVALWLLSDKRLQDLDFMRRTRHVLRRLARRFVVYSKLFSLAVVRPDKSIPRQP